MECYAFPFLLNKSTKQYHLHGHIFHKEAMYFIIYFQMYESQYRTEFSYIL